jgi:hypothetical protein
MTLPNQPQGQPRPREQRASLSERLDRLERELTQLEGHLSSATDTASQRRLERRIERRENEANAILRELSELGSNPHGWPTTSAESPCRYAHVCGNQVTRAERYSTAGRCAACFAVATQQPEGAP